MSNLEGAKESIKLPAADQQRLHDFYHEALEQYGDRDARSVRWTTTHGQEMRFRALLQVDRIDDGSVLDVGCGLGDLYKFLLRQHHEVEYTGIDIVPEFIAAAQQRYPQAEFRCQDIFVVEEQYDFVLASGALSFKVANNEEYYKAMIDKMYAQARVAVAFNMLDKATHVDDETYAAYSPVDIAEYCEKLAGRVEVVTGYVPRDFTVYLYK